MADGRILPGRKVYYNSLLCAIHMQVHFMAAETIDAKANVEKVHTFEVFGQARDPSTVELFSSAPGFVYVPKRLPQVMRMEPGVQNRFQLAVKTMAEGTMSVHVTCVDVNTKILVGSWLLMINSTAPSPDAEMETEATVGKKEFQSFPFTSPLQEDMRFNFRSSNPDVMEIKGDSIHFRAKETKNIRVFMPARTHESEEDIFLLVNSDDEKYSACFLIRIRFILKE